MTVPEEIRKGLWTFPIVMPNNPLKWLNCYVIKGGEGERNLLIDTGFPQKECIDDLLAGISALGLDLNMTDVFLTHLHSDHSGNLKLLEKMGARILLGRNSIEFWDFVLDVDAKDVYGKLIPEGVPHEVAFYFQVEGDKMETPERPDNITVLDGMDTLHYGDYEFECLFTPGHTPDHMCLFDRKNKLLLSGDHVLFDVTPNLVSMPYFPNSLEIYIQNLRRVRDLPVDLVLPAHRTQGSVSLAARVDRLIYHHERRLDEMEEIIRSHENGIGAYELASKLSWKIKARDWADFPDAQKYFASGETIAHLVYLVDHGRVRKEFCGDKYLYFAT